MKFSNLYNRLFDLSMKNITPIRFRDILRSNKMRKGDLLRISTDHLYKEMPIRFAQRVRDLNVLPFGLSQNHNISIIREWYLTSFEEITQIQKPYQENDYDVFKSVIENIYRRHSPTIITLSKGILELKESGDIKNIEGPEVQNLLDRFYRNRTEIRILLLQYLNLFKEHYSIINPRIEIKNIIEDASRNIDYICRKGDYSISLEDIVKIHGNATIPFLEDYLYYILFELLKNSVQAVIDRGTGHRGVINVYIYELPSHVYIGITDNGVGIRDADLNKIWNYSYSTHPISSKRILEDDTDFSKVSPLSGFGYGLPICRVYLNFFEGYIDIDSQYMKGTRVSIFIKRINEYC